MFYHVLPWFAIMFITVCIGLNGINISLHSQSSLWLNHHSGRSSTQTYPKDLTLHPFPIRSIWYMVYLPTWLGDFVRANVGIHIPSMEHMGVFPTNQWIGLRENLQETIDFPIKYGVFL